MSRTRKLDRVPKLPHSPNLKLLYTDIEKITIKHKMNNARI